MLIKHAKLVILYVFFSVQLCLVLKVHPNNFISQAHTIILNISNVSALKGKRSAQKSDEITEPLVSRILAKLIL